ncbi:MAG: helicase-associated domain-containing protein [Pontimonas sp.]
MSRASAAIGLIDALFDFSPRDLAQVLNLRAIPPREEWSLTDLALALSSEESVWHHVSQLTTEQVETLRELPSHASSSDHSWLTRTLLATESNGLLVLDPVVHHLLSSHPRAETSPGARPPEEATQWAAVDVPGVFGYLEKLEALVDWFYRHPGEAPKESVISAQLNSPPTAVSQTLEGAVHLGLLSRVGHAVFVTGFASAWLNQGAKDKWATLLERFISQLPMWWPEKLPSSVTTDTLRASAVSRFPLVHTTDVHRLEVYARWLGLVTADRPTVMSQATTADRRHELIEELVPADVEQLYPDGPDTLVAPGPLSSATTKKLREVGEWLSGGLAPRFRISPLTINRALQAGLSAHAIVDTLEQSVSGGMLGSLTEMVDDTATRATSLTVWEDVMGSTVRSDDELIKQLVLADRRLMEAGFTVSAEGAIRSSLPSSQIHALFEREGYPHLVRQSDGNLMNFAASPHDAGFSTPAVWDEGAVSRWQDTQRALRAEPGYFDAAVELAISERVPIRVSVLVDGDTHSMVIEPHAYRNGRLRGRDLRSDVERTIPGSLVVGLSSYAPTSEET